MNKGYIHIYFGKNWDCLPTAQGMAARACGAGFSVGFYDFCGGGLADFAQRLPDIYYSADAPMDAVARDASKFDMLILYGCDLAKTHELKKLLKEKPGHTEIVLCGAVFDDEILAMADLVSEVRGQRSDRVPT